MTLIWAIAATSLAALAAVLKHAANWLARPTLAEADPFVFWERQFWAESEQADGGRP